MKEKLLSAKRWIRREIRWIILFASTILFIEVLTSVLSEEILKRDVYGYKVITTLLMSDFTTAVAKFLTNFGGVIFLPILAGVLFIVIKNKKIGTAVLLNLPIAGLLNISLKHILQRPRPEGYRLIEESGYSFPSGHSMVSMAFYGLLIYFIFTRVKNRKIKWASIVALATLIFLIGVSRIYLGVHYLSDVCAGFFVALTYLGIYTSVYEELTDEIEFKEKVKTKWFALKSKIKD